MKTYSIINGKIPSIISFISCLNSSSSSIVFTTTGLHWQYSLINSFPTGVWVNTLLRKYLLHCLSPSLFRQVKINNPTFSESQSKKWDYCFHRHLKQVSSARHSNDIHFKAYNDYGVNNKNPPVLLPRGQRNKDNMRFIRILSELIYGESQIGAYFTRKLD